MTWAILKMILVLGAILAFLFLFARVLRRGHGGLAGSISHPEIRILATQCLAPQKYLSLVEIGGEVFALGISEASITLLTKIDNREVVTRLVTPSPKKEEGLLSLSRNALQPLFQKPREWKNGGLRKIHGT